MSLESIKKIVRIFWKYFLILFCLSLILINWSDVGWIFNYRLVTGTIEGRPEIESKNESTSTSKEIPFIKEKLGLAVEEKQIIKKNVIEIPKIDILAPIIFFNNKNKEEEIVHSSLDLGTVHFPSSAFPGDIGQTIILGHSAPPGWPTIKYDWVFSDLDNLVWGDEVFVYYGEEKYTYYVRNKVFLDKGEEGPKEPTDKNVLTLISCWPPGQNYRRIIVVAEP